MRHPFILGKPLTEAVGPSGYRGQRTQDPNHHSERIQHDRNDAEKLARFAAYDPKFSPIEHRSSERQLGLNLIHARSTLVRARTIIVNALRGLIRSAGDSELRGRGLNLAATGGKRGKGRAVVLHAMWCNSESFQAFPPQMAKAA